MSARTKSIPRTKPNTKAPRHREAVKRVSIAELRAECDKRREAEIHWRKRYFRRHEEAQALEGLLSVRDARIAELELELARKNAYILKLEKKIHRDTSEQGPVNDDASPITVDEMTAASSEAAFSTPEVKPDKRKRGKQKGAPGFGPKDHESLPIDEENTYDIDESCCPDCGDQWKPMSEEESHEVEVSVRAYRRKHRRKKYGHFCKAKKKWITKRAKKPKRLFPHSIYGISFWVFLLNGKFSLHIPINRLLTLLSQKGLSVSQGTIAAGFARILMLIAPLIAEIKRYSREEKSHWHIDDTGWKVFVKIQGKNGFGWYLWVFKSDDVCVYIVSPSRGRDVPKSHLEDSCGVISCDRLAANKKVGDAIIYAFCWVHERRHFRQLHDSYPELRAICEEFLDLISKLYHFNKQRHLHEDASVEQQRAQADLSATLTKIITRADELLADTTIHSELRRVLKGLKTDWEGLTTFLELSDIPLDNNPAEQAIRGPVIGRKNYYGSGSLESAELTAAMFSIETTLKLNNINFETFMTNYLHACANNDGKPPPNASSLLPWHQKPPPPH